MIGQRIGNYHVVRRLSETSAGVVYEAMHRRTKQHVALRVLRADLSQDQAAGVRLFNDVAALGGVQHRSVVTVHEAGMLPDGAAYIAMEHVEGHTLTARMRGEEGELDGAIALSVAWQLAGVLLAAHQRGVLHGDLRPDAVLLVPEPAAPAGVRVKLPDLGLAWLEGPEQGQRRLPAKAPLYLSPEQLELHGQSGGETTPLSDVFSLGAVLYHLLGGRPPFGDRGTAEAVSARLRPLHEIDDSIPGELAALVHSMLSANPGERPDMEQVAATLERLLVSEKLVPGPAAAAPAGRRRGGRAAALLGLGVASLLAVSAGAYVAIRAGWRLPLRASLPSPSVAAAPPEAPSPGPVGPSGAAPGPPGPGSSEAPGGTGAGPGEEPAGQAATRTEKPQGQVPVYAGPPAPPEAGPAGPGVPGTLETPKAAPSPAAADGQRPAPVAMDKAPIPPLRLDPMPRQQKKKAPARPGGRPAADPSEAPLYPPSAEESLSGKPPGSE